MREEKIKPVGSGNVFLDMGYSPDKAALLTLKSYLFIQLEEAVRAAINEGKTQDRLAKELATTQPILSNILNGKMSSFTLDRILSLLLKLKRDVHVCTAAAPAKRKAEVFVGKEALRAG